MAMHRHPAILSLFAAGIVACEADVQSGTAGSEAGNALTLEVRDTAGHPVALARVEVRAMGNTDGSTILEERTGADGRVRLALPDGNWSLLTRKGRFAAWSARSSSDTLAVDTIRPTANLSGFLEGSPGEQVSLPGLGLAARCDADGFFQLPDLPEGTLPLRVGADPSSTSRLRITAGEDALVLDRRTDSSGLWPSLASDSLVPWASRSLPAPLPPGALGDTGSFSVSVRLRRAHPSQSMTAMQWGDSTGQGIQIGWKGPDTFLLKVDEITYRVLGYTLSTQWEQVGLSWDGRRLAVLRGTDSILTLTSTALVNRSTWREPRFGSMGTAQVQWIAFHRGDRFRDWLRRLAELAGEDRHP